MACYWSYCDRPANATEAIRLSFVTSKCYQLNVTVLPGKRSTLFGPLSSRDGRTCLCERRDDCGSDERGMQRRIAYQPFPAIAILRACSLSTERDERSRRSNSPAWWWGQSPAQSSRQQIPGNREKYRVNPPFSIRQLRLDSSQTPVPRGFRVGCC